MREENTMDRKAKQIFHKELIDLLTKDADNDSAFHNRLLYALQIISNELSHFEESEGN